MFKSRKTYRRFAVAFGVMAFAVLIMGAAIAYDWLVTRTGQDVIAPQGTNTMEVVWGPDGLVSQPGCGHDHDCGDAYCEDHGYLRHLGTLNQDDLQNDDTRQDYGYPNDTQPGTDYSDAANETDYTDTAEGQIDIDYAETAADFAIHDAYGNQLRLSDFFGKPIVLNFWASWCPACVREMPYFNTLYQNMGDEVHILKINLPSARETRQAVDSFMAAGGHSFPLYFDDGGAIEYGVRSIPMTFFIDAMGRVNAYHLGAVNDEILRNGLAMIGVGM